MQPGGVKGVLGYNSAYAVESLKTCGICNVLWQNSAGEEQKLG